MSASAKRRGAITANGEVERPAATPLTLLWCLYLAFVIYGSLVPLHFVWRPLGDAVDVFRHIPFLELGIQSRADWVANLLLFIPLTFIAAQRFIVGKSVWLGLLSRFSLATMAAMLAVGIEFVQIYFPQRTVSQ